VIKPSLEPDLSEYLIPKKFPLRVVGLSDQSIFAAVQLTNAAPKDILQRFEVITVEGLRWTENGTPFLKTERGYMRADRHELIPIKKNISNYEFEDITEVLAVSSGHYYSDINFKKDNRTGKRTTRGNLITVEAVEWTNHGVPRLRTNDGYISANKDFVSTKFKVWAYTYKVLRKMQTKLQNLFEKAEKFFEKHIKH